MLNLTPHPITLKCLDGDEITFPPSGIVARVYTVESVVGTIDVFPPEIAECDEQRNTNGHRIQVVRRTFGEVIGLPYEGVECIVSAMVASAVPDVYKRQVINRIIISGIPTSLLTLLISRVRPEINGTVNKPGISRI